MKQKIEFFFSLMKFHTLGIFENILLGKLNMNNNTKNKV